MFAHQVIEDLQSWIKINNGKDRFNSYVNYAKDAIQLINKAQHFYVGDESSQLKGSISQSLKGSPLFVEKVMLPFPICTFSAHHLEDIYPDDSSFNQYKLNNNIIEWQSSKRFILAMQLSEDAIGLFLFCFVDNKKIWILQELAYTINFQYEVGEGRIKSRWLVNVPDGFDMKQKSKEDVGDLSLLYLTLLLLGCKNIRTEKILASEKLNQKRIRNGKLPIFDYKVLNVFIPGNKQNKQADKQEPLSHNRIHLCRGHFKEYTLEKPLFGFLVGRYWWQPSVRGRNKKGIVMKDYKINIFQGVTNEISQS
jgi:hypothetical protein